MNQDCIVSHPTVNRSLLFSAFNKARAKAANLDRARVNRALGYIQAGRVALLEDGNAIAAGDGETYYVTPEGCECADHTWRGSKCKHMIARWLLMKVAVLKREAPALPSPTPVAPSLDNVGESINVLWGVAA